MSLNKDATTIVARDAETLLAEISDIIESVTCIEQEHEIFAEIGCYFYRASPVIMELQTTENTPENVMDILQSLSQNIGVAKHLVTKCQRHGNLSSDADLESIISQLEAAIKQMGGCLSMIPSSTFQDQEYAEVAACSLSNEMKSVQFEVSQANALRTEELEPQKSRSAVEPEEGKAIVESDLYSIPFDFSTSHSQATDTPHITEFQKKTSSSSTQRKRDNRSSSTQRKRDNRSSFSASFLQMSEYIEPLYETFYCPLTDKIMEDPVTIETGVTYERVAIAAWFEGYENSQETYCPTTGKKLLSRVLRTNIALKAIIEEWRERNEVARIKVSRAALLLASSQSMVLEALKDVQDICNRNQHNKMQIHNAGMLPLLVKFLQYKDRDVRCTTLELLQKLAEDDGDDAKEMVAKSMDLSIVIKMLSSGHQPIKHAALLLLLELSRSRSLCKKIGSVAGGILMLIRVKYNKSTDAFSSEKADETLRNLESSPENIKHMAENGFLEPLLNHLSKGSEEMQMEMASYIGEIAVGHDSQTYLAERASPALIKMVHSGNTVTRGAAFKALAQISSYHPNAKILTKAGIVETMMEEMLTRRIYNEPMNSKNEAAVILANILESGIELENLQANNHGHKLTSDYVLSSIIYMLRNSTPDELNINLLRVLLCLTKSPKSAATIVSVVSETEASYTLVELINNPREELVVAAVKLLITLSPYMGNILVERLCKMRGQPENLILGATETAHITEKQAVSAKFLAQLPHQNLTLNVALFSTNIIPTILSKINHIQRTSTRTSRYAVPCLEGLVGILVRLTTTLYQPQMLFLAINHNFTSVFTELLMKTSSDEVQRLSAIALENLSSESITLSKPPPMKRNNSSKLAFLPKFISRVSSKKMKPVVVCPVHRGACSSQDTFCLIDAKAVERLLACLEHENVAVVKAALSAICTLLDDKVDVDKSVTLLSEVNATQQILSVVRNHKEEELWQKSFWIIEKFLMKGGDKSTSDISQDRLLPATLISAFHHGNGNTRQRAEKVLTLLNKMPNLPSSYYTM